jgi:hypothetical protein
MWPGQFPSPTPSRETSPAPTRDPLSTFGSPSPPTQHRPISSNFTAPASFRRRPRFADSQSEPVVLQHRQQPSISTSLSPIVNHRATERRRISDPLHSCLRKGSPKDGNKIQEPGLKQRAASASSAQPSWADHSTTTDDPHAAAKRLNASAQTLTVPTTAELSPRVVDIKLRQKLREPLVFSEKKGVLYIIQHPDHPEWGFKIGVTARENYNDRLDQHKNKCKFEPVVVYISQAIEHCDRAEKLVQIDLMDRCRYWRCRRGSCSTLHKEWYQVTQEVAIQTVERWRTFVNEQQPYDWRRKLTSLWGHLLENRTLQLSIHHSDIGHEERRSLWQPILSPPTHFDYFHFTRGVLLRKWRFCLSLLLYVWSFSTAFFWQILTLIYGFISLVVFRNTFASSCFALVLVCAYFSMLPDKHKLKLPRKARPKTP